ncbi:hypothetical protein KK141_17475 [Dyella sp. LX-66]|uniref:hypothetical protein n=1 Tax=unclassified Dyella TaxID=2634549 RepID=UPI001BDFAA43|nr:MULTISPECIES: hypothetical protein [unclassified Dyella]MBT2117656.1 hypothetical protein [Dyella sp. LX-1]MBT2141340.1 hypothetical protein [Dyella sp. LX-66]
MRSLMVLALLAAALSGCGSSDDGRVEPAIAPPMPEIPAAASTGTAADTPGQPDAEDAHAAGMDMVAARDVCRLPAPALARFAAYSEWVVQGDAQRKAIFIGAAQEAAELHASMIRQGRQEAYRKATCERVRRILAALERDGGSEREGSVR